MNTPPSDVQHLDEGACETLSRAVAALGELVLVVDADHQITVAAGRDGLVGRPVGDALGAGLGPLVDRLVHRCLEQGDLVVDVLPSSLVASGRMEARVVPGATGAVVALRDAGDAPRLRQDLFDARQALDRLGSALEDRVVKRTQALSSLVAQLEGANAALEQERGQVAQDLRATLTGLLAHLEQATDEATVAVDARVASARALTAAERLRDLVDDLEITSVVVRPAAAPLDLGRVVDRVRRRFLDAGAVVPIATIGRAPVVAADPVAAELALSGAVNLALDAGAPHVEVRAVEGGLDVVGRLDDTADVPHLRTADVEGIEVRQRDAGGAARATALAGKVVVHLRYEVLPDPERAETQQA